MSCIVLDKVNQIFLYVATKEDDQGDSLVTPHLPPAPPAPVLPTVQYLGKGGRGTNVLPWSTSADLRSLFAHPSGYCHFRAHGS